MLNLDIFEPITNENLSELVPGEWIWDNQNTRRRLHEKKLHAELIEEPAGFRQIAILDLDLYPKYSRHPFMLSTIDKYNSNTEWCPFEPDRYFKFKKGCNYDKSR